MYACMPLEVMDRDARMDRDACEQGKKKEVTACWNCPRVSEGCTREHHQPCLCAFLKHVHSPMAKNMWKLQSMAAHGGRSDQETHSPLTVFWISSTT